MPDGLLAHAGAVVLYNDPALKVCLFDVGVHFNCYQSRIRVVGVLDQLQQGLYWIGYKALPELEYNTRVDSEGKSVHVGSLMTSIHSESILEAKLFREAIRLAFGSFLGTAATTTAPLCATMSWTIRAVGTCIPLTVRSPIVTTTWDPGASICNALSNARSRSLRKAPTLSAWSGLISLN